MPNQGDIIWIDFSPTEGREQAGKRPVLVISQTRYNQVREMAVVCPITSSVRALRMRVRLDARTRTQGDVICEQLRTVDLQVRTFEIAEALPSDLLAAVLEIVQELVR